MVNLVVEQLVLTTDKGQKAELELIIDGEKITLKGEAKSPVYAALNALSNHFGCVVYEWGLKREKQTDDIAATGTVKIIDKKLVTEEIKKVIAEERMTSGATYDKTFQGNSEIRESEDGTHSLVGYRVVGSAIKAYFDAFSRATNKEYNVEISGHQKKK